MLIFLTKKQAHIIVKALHDRASIGPFIKEELIIKGLIHKLTKKING